MSIFFGSGSLIGFDMDLGFGSGSDSGGFGSVGTSGSTTGCEYIGLIHGFGLKSGQL
jgi:hypothetical protein